MIAASAELGINYAQRLLQDVSASDFPRFARPGEQLVTSNHPAFTFGHLTLYGQRIMEDLGGDVSAVRPPADFGSLFSKDATCQDDPHGTIYPARDMIVEAFFAAYGGAIASLRQTDDQAFLQTNPREGRLRELFPTMGAMHAFYVGGHLMVHLGQISVWRRMMGMGPA
jgi:hypothetical protein